MSKKLHEEQEEKELETNETAEDAEETTEEVSEETAEASAEDRIAALEAELKNEKDKYMRLFAEFDNFRKRTAKEKTEAYGDSAAKTIAEILPALDNFDRALDTPCSDENFKKGIEMIFTQLTDIFGKLGVTEIEALGQPFNPKLHNASKQVESEDGEKVDIFLYFCQKGKL